MPLEEAESQSSEKAAACPNLIVVSKSSRMSPEPEKISQSMLLLLTVYLNGNCTVSHYSISAAYSMHTSTVSRCSICIIENLHNYTDGLLRGIQYNELHFISRVRN